jgi:hypothetical protein
MPLSNSRSSPLTSPGRDQNSSSIGGNYFNYNLASSSPTSSIYGRQSLAQASAYVSYSTTSIKTQTKQLRDSESQLCESGEKMRAISSSLDLVRQKAEKKAAGGSLHVSGYHVGAEVDEHISHGVKNLVEQVTSNIAPIWTAPVAVDQEKLQLMQPPLPSTNMNNATGAYSTHGLVTHSYTTNSPLTTNNGALISNSSSSSGASPNNVTSANNNNTRPPSTGPGNANSNTTTSLPNTTANTHSNATPNTATTTSQAEDDEEEEEEDSASQSPAPSSGVTGYENSAAVVPGMLD